MSESSDHEESKHPEVNPTGRGSGWSRGLFTGVHGSGGGGGGGGGDNDCV